MLERVSLSSPKINFGRDCFRLILEQSALQLASQPVQFQQQSFSILCEKTPENNVANDVVSSLMNGSSYGYINLVRDPVAVFGSRRQRIPIDVQLFVAHYKHYAEPAFPFESNATVTSIRYEDLVRKPDHELQRVFHDLDLSDLVEIPSGLVDGINPLKYAKYVGTSIDPARDKSNRSLVSKEEASYIYKHLHGFCKKNCYGP